jgi:cytochrome c biogenesis protein CcdA
LLLVQLVYPSSSLVVESNSVVVEFIYYDASKDPLWCPACPTWISMYEDFLMKNDTITSIQMYYGSRVKINETEWRSVDGWAERQKYNITEPNSLIIKVYGGNFTVFSGNFNETQIQATVNTYLQENSHTPSPPTSSQALTVVLAVAFSFGFFDTFSPCLLVLLSFVLSYSLSKKTKFRDSVFQTGCFGIGFLSAGLFIGLTVGVLSLGIGSFYRMTTLIVSIFAIFFGLHQINIFKKTIIETKPIINVLAKKYAFAYGGLLVLGFAFYFLDPCIAPIFFAMLPIMTNEYLPLILLSYSIGVLLPFVFIGFLSGSISKLTRVTYRHKAAIRVISGVILVGYGIYLLILFSIQ